VSLFVFDVVVVVAGFDAGVAVVGIVESCPLGMQMIREW